MLTILLLAFAADLAPPQMPALPAPVKLEATCHCGPGCLCAPCSGNCSVVERLEAEFLAKHPNQKPWIKTGAEIVGGSSPTLAAKHSAPTYNVGHWATQCDGGTCRKVWVASAPQPAAQTKRAAVPQVQVQGRRWRIFR